MLRLNTIIKKKDDNSSYVLWWTGRSKYGVILVKCDPIIDVKVQSELAAIKYLLFTKRVFNQDILNGGYRYQLNVSNGAIKKIINRKSSKKELFRYAKFLSIEMIGVTINTVKNHTNIPEYLISLDLSTLKNTEFETICCNIDEIDSVKTRIVKTKFGDVILTRHALEQYKIRQIFGEPKNIIKSVKLQLQHPELEKFDITPFSRLLKKIKYRAIESEVWGHPSSTLKFIIVKNKHDDQKFLTTVYLKKISNHL